MGNAGPDWLWSASQRRGLLVVCAGLLTCLFVLHKLHPMYVPDVRAGDDEAQVDDSDQPTTYPAKAPLQDKIDPNSATLAMLGTLPGIGPKRAQAIIDYRQAYENAHPGKQAFNLPGDLTHIKGFGKATVAKLSPFLEFSPSTVPFAR